jgi:hypothetical protein
MQIMITSQEEHNKNKLQPDENLTTHLCLLVTFDKIVTWRLKGEIVEPEETSFARQRLSKHIATSYNIRPIVACAYRGVFIEPLPRNGLRNSVVLLLRACIT